MVDVTVTRRTLQVEHVRIDSTKTFAEVEAALDETIPRIELSMNAAVAGVEEQPTAAPEQRPKLFVFLKRDHGALLQVTGSPVQALLYEIGNPLTAMRATRRQLPAALYAPLRVVLYENAAGGATFEYDKPSTLFGQFGDEELAALGREVDAEFEAALRRAAE